MKREIRLADWNRIFLLGLFSLLPLFSQVSTSASEGNEAKTAPPERPVSDPLGRTTPYSTVVWFIRATDTKDAVRAAEYLDDRRSAAAKGMVAEDLARVLNRAMSIDLAKLSKEPSGDLNDGLRKNRELIGVATVASGRLPIYLDLIERTGETPVWLFSAETLAGIPDFAARVEGPWQEKYLPKVLMNNEFLSIELYRWVGVPLLLGLVYAGTRFLTWLLVLLLRPLVDSLSGHLDRPKIVSSSTGPVRLLLFAIVLRFFADTPVSALSRHFWNTITVILIVFSVAWVAVRIIKIVEFAAAARMKLRQMPEKIAMAKLLGRLTQILVGLSAALFVLHFIGVQLTGVFAGLGLGGVALAFGAQKTLENFLGGVMVIGDAPVRVGDLCKVGEHVGTIEDIGLRSTRIRTPDRTLVHVPNALLSAASLENFAERDKIRFHQVLGLQPETTAQQLRCILHQGQKALSSHPKVEPGSAQLRFMRVRESSLDCEAVAYVLETNASAFLEVQEHLLLQVMEIVESSGARLAAPNRNRNASDDRNTGWP